MKKHPLISILVAIVVLLLLAVLLVPLFVNANTFRALWRPTLGGSRAEGDPRQLELFSVFRQSGRR